MKELEKQKAEERGNELYEGFKGLLTDDDDPSVVLSTLCCLLDDLFLLACEYRKESDVEKIIVGMAAQLKTNLRKNIEQLKEQES